MIHFSADEKEKTQTINVDFHILAQVRQEVSPVVLPVVSCLVPILQKSEVSLVLHWF